MTKTPIKFEPLPARRWLYGYSATVGQLTVEVYRAEAGAWDVHETFRRYVGGSYERHEMRAQRLPYGAAMALAREILRAGPA